MNTYYITTPIYYITAKPHVGTLYATLLADTRARWQKLLGDNVYFVTGTDEHGQKVAQAAACAEKSPQDFVDALVPAYQQLWRDYGIKYDLFMRTTSSFHKKGAQHLVEQLLKTGAIYKSHYNGWYCTPCETFVTEHGDQHHMPLCDACGRETKYVSEESYFFRLSIYADRLLAFYEDHPDFIIPKERAHEVISFVKSGLKDLCVSRTTVTWGVPFPGDHAHTVYVWIEALCNYITAVGYGQDRVHFAQWWPANQHVLGKDIIKFHAIYWPAILMAADLPLPKQLLVHGWIQVNKQKMSKSLGNAIDPHVLLEKYGADQVRYYLLRAIPINQDGEFSIEDLEQRVASDLADDLGNLLQRMVQLALKYSIHDLVPPVAWADAAIVVRGASWDMIADVTNHMDDGMFHLALARIWEYIAMVNRYFHEQEPWKLARHDHVLFKQVLSATAHGLYVIAHVLSPFMPHKMEQLLHSLGCVSHQLPVTLDRLSSDVWQHQFLLTAVPVLFVKPEPVNTTVEIEKKGSSMGSLSSEKVNKDMELGNTDIAPVTIETFTQVALLVGTIVHVSQMPKSEKLLVLEVDFGGYGKRQILSGIKQWYTAEDLVGKQTLFVYNLQPRTMMGMSSHGMLLAAKDSAGKPIISVPATPVPNGTRLS